MKKAIMLIFAVALAGSAFAIFTHYKHKHEDAVAASAFSTITAKYKACVKAAVDGRTERFNECKKKYRDLDDDSCRVMAEASVAYDPIAACKDEQEEDLQAWRRLYPRQAKEMQRQSDEQRMR
jgi:hypothetical protein